MSDFPNELVEAAAKALYDAEDKHGSGLYGISARAVLAAVPAASPDKRLREALREIVAAFPSPPDREMDDEEIEKWYADHGDWFQRLAALAAADREAPDEPRGEKITHGRHCTCTPCAVEDWTNPAFAPCGMHGKDCPQEYQPLGPAGSFTPPRDRGDFDEVRSILDRERAAVPAASPDERLREALRDANEYLAQIADYSPSEVADAIDSVRAQIKDALTATEKGGAA